MSTGSMTDGEASGTVSGRRLPPALALAWYALFAALLVLALVIAVFGRASDGMPIVRLEIAPRAALPLKPPVKEAENPKANANETDLIGAGQEPGTGPAESQAQEEGEGAPVATPPQINLAEPQLPPERVPGDIVKPVYAGKALLADPALIQKTVMGPLPRIADDGRTPMQAYAPEVPPAALQGHKQIALVITGLGISARATHAALEDLPGGVTLAFAPYAGDAQRWVSEARKLGHEVLLEVPMEPYDFPDSDPGLHTLRPTLSEDANLERLRWALTRFTGYAGVTNLLGSRFLANSKATAPVMTYLAHRGLLFYDWGTTSRSAAQGIAKQINAPYVQGTVTIDTIQSGMEIDQRLSELEARAKANGFAVGTGFLYPVTIDQVATWAKGLEKRGFVLVPVSAIVGKGK